MGIISPGKCRETMIKDGRCGICSRILQYLEGWGLASGWGFVLCLVSSLVSWYQFYSCIEMYHIAYRPLSLSSHMLKDSATSCTEC